jgi:hypothetical protein
MATIRFSDLRHHADLARAFGVTEEAVDRFADPARQAACYRPLRLKKKGKRRQGEYRTVYKIVQDLKLFQANIGTAIVASVEFEPHVQGFVNRRSIATNAALHLGQKLILHADIHRFFESITTDQVTSAFQSIGCQADVAAVLAGICTFENKLPEGSSASPVIANLVARYLDADLRNLARSHGCRYTRYADDITLSGDTVPEMSGLDSLVRQHGFTLRPGASRTQRRGKSQFVTGLTVSDPTRPRIPRVMKRRLRMELHYATRFGLEDHLRHTGRTSNWWREVKRLGGWISFMSSVEGKDVTRRMYEKWQAIQAAGPSADKDDA